MLFSAFHSRNIKTLVKAYITYVRPLLEYNTVIWSSYKTGDISSIEKVLRGFTKRLPGLKNLTYKERLAATNFDTLELRRLRADLIVCYKIVFGLIKVDFNNFLVMHLSILALAFRIMALELKVVSLLTSLPIPV